jgi:hypothetical protein
MKHHDVAKKKRKVAEQAKSKSKNDVEATTAEAKAKSTKHKEIEKKAPSEKETTHATKKLVKEAVDKETEEKRQNKDIETRNDDAQVMDIDITKISTIGV